MRAQDWASNQPTACGAWAKPARVRWHDGLPCGPAATRPDRLERGARTPLVVTAWWPRARRRAGVTSGVQLGDEAWGNRWGHLTQEEGEVSGKSGPTGTHRDDGATTGRWGRLGTAVFR
jgi:hypothetical protein